MKTKYIKGKDGQMNGSIGSGKSDVPQTTSAPSIPMRHHPLIAESISATSLRWKARQAEVERRGAQAEIARMIPIGGEWGAYIQGTWDKHKPVLSEPADGLAAPGSKFSDTTLTSLNDVVLLAHQQRGGLAGDDRDAFVARGAKADAFQTGKRYILVETAGTVGVLNSADLPDSTPVSIERTKAGVPCSVVHTVQEQPTTDYAVIVVAEDKMGITRDGGDLVITAFPGMVTRPLNNPGIDELEGRTVTLGSVRQIVGGDLWMNTRLT